MDLGGGGFRGTNQMKEESQESIPVHEGPKTLKGYATAYAMHKRVCTQRGRQGRCSECMFLRPTLWDPAFDV